ncbi:hypothetical protein [Inediibacterium massiliense]|uniref:hypothetical protein n=1 Tax=Inediibacterium massiliense TaxID=1658111 RepID=UPI0006B60CD8|nr:hypothetical protein [Inediibacterium massiliense]
MKKQYPFYLCTLILAFLCSIGSRILTSNTSVFYYYETSWIYRIANHSILGIVLGIMGFILFLWLLFHTAYFILVRFDHIHSILKILGLLWVILLMTACLYEGITLYYLLGYVFLLCILIFSLLLIIHYFYPNI